MTKRASPFEPSICRQSKIHLNNYENDLNALKNVEERTLKKLIEGSRKLYSIILNDQPQSNSGFSKDKSVQKCVTNHFAENGKKLNENGRILEAFSMEAPNRCFYCDSNAGSVHQCLHCLEFYCSGCSFVSYESLEEKRICLSCC